LFLLKVDGNSADYRRNRTISLIFLEKGKDSITLKEFTRHHYAVLKEVKYLQDYRRMT
jgi:hypothetical protein